MKERFMHNNIEVLFNDTGDKLINSRDIEAEVIKIYHKLLGSTATSLLAVDIGLLSFKGLGPGPA